MPKYAIVGYVPPPHLPYAQAFLNNIRKFKTSHDLLLFSDHPWWAEVKLLNGSPEVVKDETAYSVSNLIFFTGMELAERAGYTHILYIEADSRVMGDGWDDVIFREFFDQRVPAVIGGSVAVHNPCTAGREAALRWEELVANNSRRNYPVATHVPILAFGNKGSADREPSCVFTYGSGTVIDMAWYRLLFSETERNGIVQNADSHQFSTFGVVSRRPQPQAPTSDWIRAAGIARSSSAWDLEIGKRIWAMFGADSYQVIANLPSIFSSYGDQITSESERLAMLKDGSRKCVHQIKSAVEV